MMRSVFRAPKKEPIITFILAVGLGSAMVMGKRALAAGAAVPLGQADEVIANAASRQAGANPIAIPSDPTTLTCPEVNEVRLKNGLDPLTVDTSTAAVAKTFAADMADRGYFSHITPEGVELGSRLKQGGVSYGYAGENIARGHKDCREVVEAWMKSPPHRANMLSQNYHKYGLAMKNLVWVIDFTD